MKYTVKQQEAIVIKAFLKEVIGHGFMVRVHDGEEWAGKLTTNASLAYTQTGSVDEEAIAVFVHEDKLDKVNQELKDFFAKCKETMPEKKVFQFSSVTLVHGNDGYDVIADNGTRLDPYIVETTKTANDLENDTYKPPKNEASHSLDM